MDNSFAAFSKAVEDSINGHAKRKNYTDNGAEGENKMLTAMRAMGIHEPHCAGEICYKVAECLKSPRRVLMEKVAGWAYMWWREIPPDKS